MEGEGRRDVFTAVGWENGQGFKTSFLHTPFKSPYSSLTWLVCSFGDRSALGEQMQQKQWVSVLFTAECSPDGKRGDFPQYVQVPLMMKGWRNKEWLAVPPPELKAWGRGVSCSQKRDCGRSTANEKEELGRGIVRIPHLTETHLRISWDFLSLKKEKKN